MLHNNLDNSGSGCAWWSRHTYPARCSCDEDARSCVELVSKEGCSAIEGVPPAGAAALALQGSRPCRQQGLLRVTSRSRPAAIGVGIPLWIIGSTCFHIIPCQTRKTNNPLVVLNTGRDVVYGIGEVLACLIMALA